MTTPAPAAAVQTPDSGPLRKFAVRIVEIPPLKAARSGNRDLSAFGRWWDAISRQDKYSISPRDYMWNIGNTGPLEWIYALPPGVDDTGGYERLDFRGGLYAVMSCREEDLGQAHGYMQNWVRRSGLFDLEEKTIDRYGMSHVITPQLVKQRLGYDQMDHFVPIQLKARLPAARPELLKASFAVRIIRIPPVRMARSGTADLKAFCDWWSALSAKDAYRTSPRDFMWYNPKSGKEEWLYALPQGVDQTGGFETLDFPGGLYAVTCCRESELGEAGKYVRDFIRQSGSFALDEGGADRYSMCHVTTPADVGKVMGLSQMDFFVPIQLQGAVDRAGTK